MKSKVTLLLVMLLITAGAAAFRLPELCRRPMHTDEAVHTAKFERLLTTGQYEYDTHDYHGPTMYYFTLPVLKLAGVTNFDDTSEWMYRLVPAVFGIALVLLTLGLSDGLGRTATVAAGILAAVSPAMVFYSRYYIMEMLLVFFSLSAVVCGWRFVQSRRAIWALAWAILCGASLAFMHATKETCIISMAAMIGAVVAAAMWERLICHQAMDLLPIRRLWMAAPALAAGVAVSVALFSVWFQNWDNVSKSVTAYSSYLHRSGGAGVHIHPWGYYLEILCWYRVGDCHAWTECLIVALAAIGALASLLRKNAAGMSMKLARFLTFYSTAMLLVYSTLKYKTPWCMLGFLHGMILLAGVGTATILEILPGKALKALAGVVLLAGAAHMGYLAYENNFRYQADKSNPYVYAHPVDDVYNLVRVVKEITDASPTGEKTHIKVIVPDDDYWPLPWYFRRYENVGYYNAPPEKSDARIIIASPVFESRLAGSTHAAYRIPEGFHLRMGLLLWLHVRDDTPLPATPRPTGKNDGLGDLLRLQQTLADVEQASDEGKDVTVGVIAPGGKCGPLPWLLRPYARTAYYEAPPKGISTSVLISPPALEAELMKKIDSAYLCPEDILVAPGTLMRLYVKPGLWDRVENIRARREQAQTREGARP